MPQPEQAVADISRRRLLATAAASVLGAVFTPGLVACGTKAKSPEGATGFWATIATAARAGDPSLSADSAIAELGPELGAVDRTQLDRPGPSVLEAFTKRSTDDFAAGRTVVVVGWLLSRTEVLLATVAAEVTR